MCASKKSFLIVINLDGDKCFLCIHISSAHNTASEEAPMQEAYKINSVEMGMWSTITSGTV